MINAVFDVVIGLALMFLLLSLICTIINEFIASICHLRARNLAKGIDDIIDDENLLRVFKSVKFFEMAGRASGRKGPSYIPSKTFALSLLEALDPEGESFVDKKMADVRKAIDSLQDSKVKGTLSTLARDAQDDFERYRNSTAEWFDNMMDRLGGKYKRNMQYLSISVAALLVVAINADSIQVATALWKDEVLRESVVQSATNLVDQKNTDNNFDLNSAIEKIRPFPIGWDFKPSTQSGDWFRSFEGWLLKLFGLVFTTLAVSLGAPFWFDLLNKFIRVRSSGGTPAPQRENISK